MQYTWRDALATLLTLIGAVVVFARLKSYSWWLIGSWKGALGVMAVIGLGIFALYLIDLVKFVNLATTVELVVWVFAATLIIACLATRTTKVEFIWSAALLGLSWLAPFVSHLLVSTHHHSSHYAAAH